MRNKNLIYVAIPNSDDFRGISIPKKFRPIIESIEKNNKDYIYGIFENYNQYRDLEVEYASQARDGSAGTEDIQTLDELVEYFNWILEKDKISKELIDNFVDIIEVKEKVKKVKKTFTLKDIEDCFNAAQHYETFEDYKITLNL
jgi:hypothetical protein